MHAVRASSADYLVDMVPAITEVGVFFILSQRHLSFSQPRDHNFPAFLNHLPVQVDPVQQVIRRVQREENLLAGCLKQPSLLVVELLDDLHLGLDLALVFLIPGTHAPVSGLVDTIVEVVSGLLVILNVSVLGLGLVEELVLPEDSRREELRLPRQRGFLVWIHTKNSVHGVDCPYDFDWQIRYPVGLGLAIVDVVLELKLLDQVGVELLLVVLLQQQFYDLVVLDDLQGFRYSIWLYHAVEFLSQTLFRVN